MEGYINIDMNPQSKADLVRDVRFGLPYDDASVDAITACHFLEHLTCDEMMFVLEECYRVMKKDAQLTIVVPIMEFSSLDHKQWLVKDSFDIFGRDAAQYYNRKFAWNIAAKTTIKNARGENLKITMEAVK